MTMKHSFFIKIALLFVLAGTLVSSQYLISHLKNNAQPLVGAKVAAAANQEAADTQPTHVSIPAVGISVKIVPGYYRSASKDWSVSETEANFATPTTVPNSQSGLTYIYGHNRVKIFEDLPKVKEGDKAIVTTGNGHVFTYVAVSRLDTKSGDTSLMHYQGKPILVLQTCTGFLYQNRSQFTFNFESER
jgi:LPXTG-site transpeptidase (sortase) family protein